MCSAPRPPTLARHPPPPANASTRAGTRCRRMLEVGDGCGRRRRARHTTAARRGSMLRGFILTNPVPYIADGTVVLWTMGDGATVSGHPVLRWVRVPVIWV